MTAFKKTTTISMLMTLAILTLLLGVVSFGFLRQPSFGKSPSGERLLKIQHSPNYRDGKFKNRTPTSMMIEDKSILQTAFEFIFRKVNDLEPAKELPAFKTQLKTKDASEEILIWLGHSSLYLQTQGKRILIDPVLVSASPISYFNKPFKGTNGYQPDDMPDRIDYVLLTHDHWDHLDYQTITALNDRVHAFICPLGVGAHLEHWGVAPAKIHELDWYDEQQATSQLKFTALPARHFSGRGLTRDQSLWVSYMIQTPTQTIFLSGDTGYDTHFREIKSQFGKIDLAIMENGQYNEDWKDIHIMPDQLVTAIEELSPHRVMTIHNSKFALGKHAWYEPLDNIRNASNEKSFPLITPAIGEVVRLADTTQVFKEWWKVVK